MVNSVSCGCQRVLQPVTVRRNRRRGETPSNTDMAPAYQTVAGTMKDSRQVGVLSIVSTSLFAPSRFALLAHRQLQRWPCGLCRARQALASGNCCQGPSAPTEIAATSGSHHEGAIGAATPDSGRCTSSVTVDIQKHFDRRGKTAIGRFRDVSKVKGLTAFD